MSRTLFFSLLMLLSGKAILAEEHHHGKKDTVVIMESAKNHHHDHCEEKRSFKALCCQFTRSYVREGLAVILAGSACYMGQGKSDQLPATLLAGCVGFSAGHVIKKITKLTMYLNNIPKK